MGYLTELLGSTHEKIKFNCGKEPLDSYIQKQAKQDIRGKVSVCFVYAIDNKIIQGYYTLANGSIPRTLLPEIISKKLPKYKDLPVTLLGRLAVDKKFQGKKLGELLLLDALKRSYEASLKIGSMAIVVDPIDSDAIAFYKKYSFIELPSSGRMFLPMQTIELLFQNPF